MQIPGNDDSGAMAALLVFHILGMYPVPASKQLLLGSPLVSSFTINNDFLRTSTKFTVNGFDTTSVTAAPPSGSRLYVTSVSVNGRTLDTVCCISFDDVVGGGQIVIKVDGDADAAAARGCGSSANSLPDSLGAGGFTIPD